MYQDLVKTLPIEFMGFKTVYIKTEDNPVKFILRNYLTAEEWMNKYPQGYRYSPDFYIFGYLYQTSIQFQPIFRVDPNGPYILCLTAIDKNAKDLDSRLYRNNRTPLWAYYWEDTKIGYLTQVHLRTNFLIPVIC